MASSSTSESDSLPVSSAVQSTKVLQEPIQTTEKHSFQGFGVEKSEILVQSPYGQYKMCTDGTGQNE